MWIWSPPDSIKYRINFIHRGWADHSQSRGSRWTPVTYTAAEMQVLEEPVTGQGMSEQRYLQQKTFLSQVIKTETMSTLSFYQKLFLQNLGPECPLDLNGEAVLLTDKEAEDSSSRGDTSAEEESLREQILEQELLILPRIPPFREWIAIKQLVLKQCNGRKVQIFKHELEDSEKKNVVVVVGFKEAVEKAKKMISEYLDFQDLTTELVPFGDVKEHLLRYFSGKPNTLKAQMRTMLEIGVEYKVLESGIEIKGTTTSVKRAKEVISRMLLREQRQSDVQTRIMKNAGIKIHEIFLTPQGLHIFFCFGQQVSLLCAEALIIQERDQSMLPGLYDTEEVVSKTAGVMLTSRRRVTDHGKLQRIITLYWRLNGSCSNNSCAVLLGSAITLALEYLQHQDIESVAMLCPLIGPQGEPAQAKILLAALEDFSRRCFLFPSSWLSVFLVSNEKEEAKELEKILESCWCPMPERKDKDYEFLDECWDGISSQIVCESLEETKTDVLVLPVSLSDATNSIKVSSLAPIQIKGMLEKLLASSSSLVTLLQKGNIVPVSCQTTCFDCKYFFLVANWEDPSGQAEGLRNLLHECLELCQNSFFTSLAFPVLDLRNRGVTISQSLLWLLEGLQQFHRVNKATWLHSLRLVLSPDCGEETMVMKATEGPEEIIGSFIFDDPLFIQYLQDFRDVFVEMFSYLLLSGIKLEIFQQSQQPCFLATPASSPELTFGPLARWRKAVMDSYSLLRRRYVVRKEDLSCWMNPLSSTPPLQVKGSNRVYEEGKVLVGPVEEVEKILKVVVVQEFLTNLCCPATQKAAMRAFRTLKEKETVELNCPEVSISASKDLKGKPLFVLQGPLEAVNTVREVFLYLFCQALLSIPIQENLSPYQCSFLKMVDLEVFSEEVLHSREICAKLDFQKNEIFLNGKSQEDCTQGFNVLKVLLQEVAIGISSSDQKATLDSKWKDFLRELSSRLNTSRRKVVFHIAQKQGCPATEVKLVGFRAEILAAKSSINDYLYLNAQITNMLEFTQPHLVEAGSQLPSIMEWQSLGAVVDVQVQDGHLLQVIVSGRRVDVLEVLPLISQDLEAVVQRVLRITRPWATEYFRRLTGAEVLESLRQNQHCLIQVKDCSRPADVPNSESGASTRQDLQGEVSLQEGREEQEGIDDGSVEGVDIQVTGKLADAESALEAITRDFHSAHIRDIIIHLHAGKLSPEQLGTVKRQNSVTLRQYTDSISIKGLPNSVAQARIHLEELLEEIRLSEVRQSIYRNSLNLLEKGHSEVEAYSLPPYWDSMNGSTFLKVALRPDSKEYQVVRELFNETANAYTVTKIERIQNLFLRRAYELKWQHMKQKNGQDHVREKFLFHGTQKAACSSIEKSGFNRSHSGQNGTACGSGVYFAVEAQYSTNHAFSRPERDGSKCMLLARVLTGFYTSGRLHMKVPPLRSLHDSYDSLVDNLYNPTMFVIFHDDQAYPDYRIVFQ
nr:PREDICTED: uncharacterized protein LOC102687816 isoform X2 [Lepisosteus oculatus]